MNELFSIGSCSSGYYQGQSPKEAAQYWPVNSSHQAKGTTMSYVIAFLMAVGHDPRKLGSANTRNALWERALLLGFVGAAALFFCEVVSS